MDELPAPAVVVLVGAAGSGKTTLRGRLVAGGLDPGTVISLDDLRCEARALDAKAGRPVRPLQDYSFSAVRRAARRCDALLAFGAGYLSDATQLRRRERVPHVRAAAEAGLPSVALLLPALSLDELLARDAARPPDEHVPADVLARHAHRRSLLRPGLLRDEGFDVVREVP
ncbi:AAA family ATPase [Motilibacter deserti]|uniref:ATP-binding protein n=1 Tax=Motilibacter deserti TaxID=2714956 RepID=A0ABX0H3E8_9ACTN|nr:ATP-binding protein [Motilibacter deserti]